MKVFSKLQLTSSQTPPLITQTFPFFFLPLCSSSALSASCRRALHPEAEVQGHQRGAGPSPQRHERPVKLFCLWIRSRSELELNKFSFPPSAFLCFSFIWLWSPLSWFLINMSFRCVFSTLHRRPIKSQGGELGDATSPGPDAAGTQLLVKHQNNRST